MSRKNSPKRNKNKQKNSRIIKNKLYVQNIIKVLKSLDIKTKTSDLQKERRGREFLDFVTFGESIVGYTRDFERGFIKHEEWEKLRDERKQI